MPVSFDLWASLAISAAIDTILAGTEQAKGDGDPIRIEQPLAAVIVDETQIDGTPRFAHRTTLSGQALIIDLQSAPYRPDLPSNDAAPAVSMLRDRPMDQEAFDAEAEPGDFVTPPAATRR